MKKIMMFTMAAVLGMSMMTGCKTTEIPSAEKVYALSEGTGKATAVVVKLAKVDTNAVYTACAVMEKLVTVIPGSNDTFETVWVPAADKMLDDLVQKGKIKEEVKPLVALTVDYTCKGLDYEFKLHPVWKQYENLVSAGTTGFLNGFEGAYGYTSINLFEMSKDTYSEDDVKAICELCNVPYMCPKARVTIIK